MRDAYADIFGWELHDSGPEFGGYVNATRDGAAAAGLASTQDPHQPTAWLVYLASRDADATAVAITAAGGTVLFGPADVGPVGRLVVAMDPTGARFGVWQHGSHIGCEIVGEPGALAWEHLHTGDTAAARAFYGAVFGWSFTALDMEADGFTFGPAGEPPYGSLGSMAGADTPAHWMPYFAVASTDDAVARLVAAGGAVRRAAAGTPWGRMAELADSSGAAFTVMEIGDARQPERAG